MTRFWDTNLIIIFLHRDLPIKICTTKKILYLIIYNNKIIFIKILLYPRANGHKPICRFIRKNIEQVVLYILDNLLHPQVHNYTSYIFFKLSDMVWGFLHFFFFSSLLLLLILITRKFSVFQLILIQIANFTQKKKK